MMNAFKSCKVPPENKHAQQIRTIVPGLWLNRFAGSPVALLILVGSDGPQGMALPDVSVALPEDRILAPQNS